MKYLFIISILVFVSCKKEETMTIGQGKNKITVTGSDMKKKMGNAMVKANLAKAKSYTKQINTYLEMEKYNGSVEGALPAALKLDSELNYNRIHKDLKYKILNPESKWVGDSTPYIKVTIGDLGKTFAQDGSEVK